MTGIGVSLTGQAATALNGAFGVHLFSGGACAGNREDGAAARCRQPQGHRGDEARPLGRSAVGADHSRRHPVGRRPGNPGSGRFPLPGIKLSKHSTSAELTDFIIGLDKSPDLTAKTPAGRASIGKLDLSAAKLKVQPGKRKIDATGIKVKLTSAAASLLNGALGTSFAAGDLLGTASTSVVAK